MSLCTHAAMSDFSRSTNVILTTSINTPLSTLTPTTYPMGKIGMESSIPTKGQSTNDSTTGTPENDIIGVVTGITVLTLAVVLLAFLLIVVVLVRVAQKRRIQESQGESQEENLM